MAAVLLCVTSYFSLCLCYRYCLQVCNAILALAGLGMLGECFATKSYRSTAEHWHCSILLIPPPNCMQPMPSTCCLMSRAGRRRSWHQHQHPRPILAGQATHGALQCWSFTATACCTMV